MDLLGSQGEKAEEEVQQIKQRMDELESHIDAVDSAFQDFQADIQHIMENELKFHEEEIKELEESVRKEGKVNEIEKRVEDLETKVGSLQSELRNFVDSKIEQKLSEMTQGVRSVRSLMNNFSKELNELENRVDDIESEFVMEVNNRDFDFEKKLDKRTHEKDKEELQKDIRKLKASVNILADEIDKRDDIEVQ